ncbi:hypothetical protein TKK_0002354 [Trichogramma kaykai]
MSVKRNKQCNIVTVEDPYLGCDAIVPDTSRMNKPWPSMKIRKMIEDEKAFNALIDRKDEEFARKTGRTNYSSYKRNGKKEIGNNKIDIEVLHPFLSTHESKDVTVDKLRIDFNSLAADTAMPKKQHGELRNFPEKSTELMTILITRELIKKKSEIALLHVHLCREIQVNELLRMVDF